MTEWIPVRSKSVDLLVSRDGSVRTEDRMIPYQKGDRKWQMVTKGRELSQCKNNMGYIEVACSVGSRKRIKHLVHRLIAMAFVPGYEEHKTVNHINGNKLDNRPENLEWVEKGENTAHAWNTGLVDLRGEGQPGHKLTERQVSHIKKALSNGMAAHSLSIIAGVSVRTICLIRDGHRWAHVPGATTGRPAKRGGNPAH